MGNKSSKMTINASSSTDGAAFLNLSKAPALNTAREQVFASNDIVEYILSFSPAAATALNRSTSTLYAASKQVMLERKADHLIKCLAVRNLLKAEALLQQTRPEDRLTLLKVPAEAEDYFGRKFSRLTAFQYTLWDLSARPARDLLMRYMPAKEITRQLRAHYANENNNYNRHGKHFSFMPLINALNVYVLFLKRQTPPATNWDEADRKCREEVGGAQRWSTAEIIHQHCHPSRKLGNSQDSFASPPGSRLMEDCQDSFYYSFAGNNFRVSQFLGSNGLGKNLVLYRGFLGAWMSGRLDLGSAKRELADILAFSRLRIQEYNVLIKRFAPEISLLVMQDDSPRSVCLKM